MKKYFYFIVFFSIGLLYGCHDAPRDNPLDPLSPNYVSQAGITGTVSILFQNVPLSDATITSIEDGISTTSSWTGVFSFTHLTVGTKTLVCTKANYTPDTQRVVLQSLKDVQVHFNLNGAPSIVSQNIYTRKIDQYYPNPQYFVDVTASVTDPNGITDIDSVWVFIPYALSGSSIDTLFFPMAYSISSRLFQATVYMNSLPTNKIQWLVNKPLQIRSRDFHGAINYSNPFYISRIIENTADPVYPTINPTTSVRDTTSPTPLLHWYLPLVTYNYTYLLTLSRLISGILYNIGTYSNIPSGDNALQYPGDGSNKTLDPGDYVWTIMVIDDFGNYSRSKEASFVVK